MSDNFANPLKEAKTDTVKAAESITGLLNPQSETEPSDVASKEDTQQQTQDTKQEDKVQEQPSKESETDQPEAQEQTSEAKPEKEAADEEEVSQEQTNEIQQEQNSTYKVKVAGQELDVTLDELRNGYSRDADYRRKTEELAYEKRQFQSQSDKQKQDYSQKLSDLNQLMQVAKQQINSEINAVDLEKLYDEDPTEAARIEHRLKRKQEKFNQALQHTKAAQQKELETFVIDQQKLLATKVPEFSDPAKSSTLKSDMRNYLVGYGFNDQEIGQIYDHRIVMLVNDAMKYRGLQKAKPNIAKKITKPSKVFSSGAKKDQESVNSQKFKEKLSRLKKSGHVKDATAVFLDVINN